MVAKAEKKSGTQNFGLFRVGTTVVKVLYFQVVLESFARGFDGIVGTARDSLVYCYAFWQVSS